MVYNTSNLFKLVIILGGVVWQCFILSYHPFYFKKHRFARNEKIWNKIYEYNDSLFFRCDELQDTVVVYHKGYYNPRNEFGFDWEDRNINYLLKLGNTINASLLYVFKIKHCGEQKKWNLLIEKTGDHGIDISSTFSGIDAREIKYQTTDPDTLLIYSRDYDRVANQGDYGIEGVDYYKLTPADGLIEYSFEDGRVYKLIEHRRTLHDMNEVYIP